MHMYRRTLRHGLLLSLLVGSSAGMAAGPASQTTRTETTRTDTKSDTKSETIKLPLPWKAGQTLRYQNEQVKTATAPGKREKSITASKSDVLTTEAGPAGVVQQWRWNDSSVDVLEGEKIAAGMVADAMKGIEDVALVIQMDEKGTYQAIRNLDEVAQRMRTALRPVMLTLMTEGLDKASVGVEAGKRAEMLAKAPVETDAFLQRFTAPKLLEAMLTRDIQTLLNFTGAELDDGQSYELDTVLENPTGGAPFPAKLTFGLYVDQNEPEDVYLEWTMEIDPVKGADAIWDTVEKLYGRTFSVAERKELPAQVSIVDKGFIVFERLSGVPEMYENERTTKLGQNANYERNRMRLLEGGHGHEWAEQDSRDTEPDMNAGERDAQLCADPAADTDAGIAACSRTLESGDLEPKVAARWYASRAQHRGRAGHPGQMRDDLDKAIALQPGDAELYLQRATADFGMEDFKMAQVDAQRAADLQPDSARAQLYLGGAIEKQGRFAEALPYYDRAIVLAPGDVGAYDARCWARAMSGDLVGARSDCDQALLLEPGMSNSLNSRGYVNYRAGRHADAVRDYDGAIASNPEVASSWYVRGMAKRAMGDDKGAGSDIAKATRLDAGIAQRYAGYGVK